MLVLSRKKHEAICIGEDVRVVVVEVREGRARLGIEAPKNIPVHREEVHEAIQRNKQITN